MKVEIEPTHVGERAAPERVKLDYEGEWVTGTMVIEECTTEGSTSGGSGHLIFTTGGDNMYKFRRCADGEGIISTVEDVEFPALAIPSDSAIALEDNLYLLCERE
ncbi:MULTISPECIES: hypothetical protein [Haloferacaceae]|uniref:Uncharacterized protein n=2 Tax=Haloferacaceae TaxID=1644056 RepID=A0ABD6DCX2_9EURY|nr:MULTISPECIES: hypothetical protein [Halorubraceae]